MVLSVAGKYAYDRETLPRVWVKCAPVDPNLPVRGRYVSLRLEVDGPPNARDTVYCHLSIVNGRLTAKPARSGIQVAQFPGRPATLVETVPYFISEHAQDPTDRLRKPGEELWVEVSLPVEGLPRPLRIAPNPVP
jgi:GDYXXLXY protein